MFVSYKINPSLLSGATATTIDFPINMEYQLVDNSELVERVFVNGEIEKSVNPILDYEKARFIPVYDNLKNVDTITYIVSLLGSNGNLNIPTYYSDIEIKNDDIKFRKNAFTESALILSFYDNDNPLTQNLVTEIEIYSHLSSGDYYVSSTSTQIAGQPKPANQIPLKFVLSNPLTTPVGFYEGYHIYAYRDEYLVNNPPKSLYMKAQYFSAKTGKILNLSTSSSAYPINNLIYKLYTKFDLYRNTTGFYYSLDTTYSTNVQYSSVNNPNLMNLTINLYQIQAL